MSTSTAPVTATGRRKTAVASVNLLPGKGAVEINGRDIDDYFTTSEMKTRALLPLVTADLAKKFDVKVRAHGGGLMGQAGAISLAVARALIQVDPALRPALKKPGFLKRDPRMKERKKSGQPGARKRFQFSKR
ncbi:MAG: 30S ribosomal protein S9 [Verrucomicrobia bacterium Tous-C9LFEB]|nr:MAG: 30S ribosomal protein S9 [Verrucomicrobia bacterium Tous-C9LFEB]